MIGDVSGGCKRVEGGAAALAPEDTRDGGGAYSDDPQSGCGDDGAGDRAEKPVTPDP